MQTSDPVTELADGISSSALHSADACLGWRIFLLTKTARIARKCSQCCNILHVLALPSGSLGSGRTQASAVTSMDPQPVTCEAGAWKSWL